MSRIASTTTASSPVSGDNEGSLSETARTTIRDPERAAQLAECGFVVKAHGAEIRTLVKTLQIGRLSHS